MSDSQTNMTIDPKTGAPITGDLLALQSRELYNRYNNSARQDWASNVREDEQFRFNKQFTKKQKGTIESRGHSAVVINQIDPAVEASKAIMTSRKPGWSCVGREDTDVKSAKMVEFMLEHMYDLSNGRMIVGNSAEDYSSKSMAAFLAFYDKNASYGKGRVMFTDIDPLELFIDPSAKRRDIEDAENILIVKEMTLAQAIRYMPDKKEQILKSASSYENIYPLPDLESDEGLTFPGEIDSDYLDEKRLMIERYTKKQVRLIRVLEQFTNSEFAFTEEEYQEYLGKTYLRFQNTVIEADDAEGMQLLMSQIDPTQLSEIQEVTGEMLVEEGLIQSKPIEIYRVCRYISIEDQLLVEEIMGVDEYPIKVAMNKWNRTPYPSSDVRFAKGINQYINKFNSLLIAHTTRSTNIPLLIPRGSADIKTVREEWHKPDAVIDFNPEFGTPFTPSPTPIASEAFTMIDRWKKDIQYQFGISELMHGFSEDSPATFRGTMAMEEYGQRKIKSKLRDIEDALAGIGRVAFKMMQQYYTQDEVVRIMQPSGQVSEIRINYMGVDDFSGEIKKFNDMSIGEYDIRVLAGSTLPSNRWAQFDYYMQLADRGYIDQVEVLKKTELVDVDGVLNRMSYVKQLEEALQKQEEEIKKLSGDLQTAERESLHDRKRVEVEKFKSNLKGIESETRAASSVYESRLGDELGNIRRMGQENKSVAEKSKRKKERK